MHTGNGSYVSWPIWYSEVHANGCMGRDSKMIKPGVLYCLRGNEFGAELSGNEFGAELRGNDICSAIDKSPIKNHKSGSG